MRTCQAIATYQGKPLQGYSGQKLKVVGQADVNVEYEGQQVQLQLLIVEGEHKPTLFGHDWLTVVKLGCTSITYVVTQQL